MKIWKRVGWGMLLVLSVSCSPSDKETDRLESALQASGSNRIELEKVLEYYSGDPKDSLKRKAAVFLIENMPGHRGPDLNSIAGYKARIDSMTGISGEERKILLNLPMQHPELCPGLQETEDVHTMKATQLIGHIEQAFHLKESRSWLKEQDFGLFCEYLLPYRVENEWVEFTGDTLPAPLEAAIGYAVENYHDCRHSVNAIATYIQREPEFKSGFRTKDTVLSKYIYNSENANKRDILRLRRLGIPVAWDYVPVCRLNEKDNHWYVPMDSRLSRKSAEKIKNITAGKIYRRTFSAHPCPVSDGEEYIPPFFRNPFQQDVTDLYLYTADVSLSLEIPSGIRYIYLAMYDGENWQPVAYTERKGEKCVFRKMGKNRVYLPVGYPQGKMQPLAPPFILRTTAMTVPLSASTDTATTFEVERLFPYVGETDYHHGTLMNASFECADNGNFENPDTVCTVRERPYYRLHSIRPEKEITRRYWRLEAPQGYCELAELHFLDTAGKQLRGKYILPNPANTVAWTDNDPLTKKAVRPAVVIDFGQAVKVAEIRYMLANDGHNIRTGNEYELLYYEKGEWRTGGRQTAEDQSIIFRDVPADRLYQLRDITDGKKGNPFTWDGKRVRFW